MLRFGSHRLIVADVLDGLRALDSDSVQCVVTSPPYWGLRDYGTGDAQLGLEATPAEHIAAMVRVFDEVRRVLRPDGVAWVNYGDSYATAGHDGAKPKDLVGIPWRFAFAMQDAGWWLRSDVIWSKPNPMPESVTDRPTKAHEYLFLLTKSARYYYDADAIRQPHSAKSLTHRGAGRMGGKAGNQDGAGLVASGNWGECDGERRIDPRGCNARTVWSISTQAYADAHFATFPEEIPRRCISAGTSERGACGVCGSPRRRDVERAAMVLDRSSRSHEKGRTRASGKMVSPPTSRTIGWSPSCDCDAETVPCVVLDPFAGSGTTLAVACQLGRDAIGIELNPEYAELAERRIGRTLRPNTYRDETKDEGPSLFNPEGASC